MAAERKEYDMNANRDVKKRVNKDNGLSVEQKIRIFLKDENLQGLNDFLNNKLEQYKSKYKK